MRLWLASSWLTLEESVPGLGIHCLLSSHITTAGALGSASTLTGRELEMPKPSFFSACGLTNQSLLLVQRWLKLAHFSVDGAR